MAAKDYAAPPAAHLLRKSKVGHLDVAVPVEKDVLRLEVTVKDAALVQVLEDERHLGGVETRCVVGKAARPSQVREELAADDVLHQQVEVEGVLEGAAQVDDEWVRDLRKHLLLRLDVLYLLQMDHLRLLQDLESVVPAVAPEFDEADPAKAPRAERLFHLKLGELQALRDHHGGCRPLSAPGLSHSGVLLARAVGEGSHGDAGRSTVRQSLLDQWRRRGDEET